MSKDSFEMKPTLNNQEIKVCTKETDLINQLSLLQSSDRNSQKVKKRLESLHSIALSSKASSVIKGLIVNKGFGLAVCVSKIALAFQNYFPPLTLDSKKRSGKLASA